MHALRKLSAARPSRFALPRTAATCFLGLVLGVALGLLPGPEAAAEDPPPPAAPTGPAGLQLEKAEYDFGIVEQNSEYVATVGYRNTGPKTLTNLRVKADCGCYGAALTAPELAPDATGTVTVRFRTLSFRGVVVKKLSLLYEDGAPQRRVLKLRLRVFGGVLVDPGRLHFGEVLEGTKPEGAVDLLWYPDAGEPFEINKIEIPGEPIETSVTPYDDPKHKERKGWHVQFRFTAPPKRGVYSKKAIVHLSHPRTPMVNVPLTAHVMGKVWVQSHRVHLGLLPQGASKSATVLVRHFDKATPIGRISGKSRKGVLRVTVEDTFTAPGPGPNDPPRPAKLVRVTVPADAPVGPLNDDIEIRTEVPGEETVVIQVRGRVYRRTGG